MSYKFTDAKEMVERKVVRSEMAQKLLMSHVSVFTKEIEIRTMYMDACKTKISLLQNMNKIEEMQLNEYSKEREDSINEIVVDLNTMDDGLMVEIEAIQEDIQKIKLEGVVYSDSVGVLNDLIPTEGVVTNYKVKGFVKFSRNDGDSMGGRCMP